MHFLVTTTIVFVMALSASAQDKAKIQQEVTEVDRARGAAFVKGDGDAWAKHIADNCHWTTMSTGAVVHSKAEFATNITKRGPLEGGGGDGPSDEKFHVDENVVVQTGDGGVIGRYARVYTKIDGRWQMIALYTTNPITW